MSKRRTNVKCKQCKKEENVPNSRATTYVYCSRKCMSKSFTKSDFKIGDYINNWKITDDYIKRKYGRSYLKVQCSCGSDIESLVLVKHLKTKKARGCHQCCGNGGYKGYKKITGEYWSTIKSGAEKRNISFDLNMEEVWQLFEKQNKKCALSGLEIELNRGKSNRSNRTASLDRIDSKKGYTLSNVQWVHKDVNIMKNKFDQKYFIKLCKFIGDKNAK